MATRRGRSRSGSGRPEFVIHVRVDKSNVRADLEEVNRVMRSSATEINSALEIASKAFGAIQSAAGFVGRAFVDAAQSAREYGKAVAEVTTIASEAEFPAEKIRDLTFDLAKTYGSDIQGNAKALYQTISSGVTDASTATALLNQANKLAIGGLTDLTTSVDGLTSILNAYKADGLSAAEATNTLFVAIRDGKTTANELAANLGQVTGIAAQAGVSFNEVAASVASITLNGVSTETAVIQLRQVIASIMKPSSGAAAEARRLGVDFSIAALKSKGLQGVLDAITSSAKFNDESLGKLFGNVRALSGAMTLTAKNGEALKRVLRDTRTELTASEDAFRKMTQTLDHQVVKFDALQDAAMTALGEAVTGSANATKGLKGLNAALESTIEFFEGESGRQAVDAFFGAAITGAQAMVSTLSSFFATVNFFTGDSATAALEEQLDKTIRIFEAYKHGGQLTVDFTEEVAKANVDAFRELLSIQEMFADGTLSVMDEVGMAMAKRAASLQNHIDDNRNMYRERRGQLTDLIEAEKAYARSLVAADEAEKKRREEKPKPGPAAPPTDDPKKPKRPRGRRGPEVNDVDLLAGLGDFGLAQGLGNLDAGFRLAELQAGAQRADADARARQFEQGLLPLEIDEVELYFGELKGAFDRGFEGLSGSAEGFASVMSNTVGGALEGFSAITAQAFTDALLGVDEGTKAFNEALGDMVIGLGSSLIQWGITASALGLIGTAVPALAGATGGPAGLGAGAAATAAGAGMVLVGKAMGGGASAPSGGGSGGSGNLLDSGLNRRILSHVSTDGPERPPIQLNPRGFASEFGSGGPRSETIVINFNAPTDRAATAREIDDLLRERRG